MTALNPAIGAADWLVPWMAESGPALFAERRHQSIKGWSAAFSASYEFQTSTTNGQPPLFQIAPPSDPNTLR
jgi:hypothetical protein